jgi:hypothetical protein
MGFWARVIPYPQGGENRDISPTDEKEAQLTIFGELSHG